MLKFHPKVPTYWSELGTHHISCEVSWLLVLLITILMFIIMFTFVVFSHQLTLPFPSSWNIDVNLEQELFGLIPRYIAWPNAAYNIGFYGG